MNTHTQCLRLLKALRRKRGITSFEAFAELHITSLHRRLSDLREMGVVIQSKETEAKYLRYFATHVPAYLLDAISGKKREVCHA